MAEYIEKKKLVNRLKMWLMDLENDMDKGDYGELCENKGAREAVESCICEVEEQPLADVQPINQWISVNDKLPEEAVKVLIYTEYNATAYGFFTGAYYNNRPLFAITMNRNSEHSWYEEIRVSHWMLLPESPKGGDKDG